MARITLFMLPEAGHLLPTFRFARQLKERGHEICYATFQEYRNEIETLGFAFTPIFERFSRVGRNNRSMLETKQAVSQWYEPLLSQLRNAGTTFIAEMINDITPVQSDLLILDSALGVLGGLAEHGAAMSSALQRLECQLLRISPTFTEVYQPFPTSEFFERLPELILCPREFDLPSASRPRHERHFVEPSVFRDRPRIPFSWEKIDRNRPLVYCSFGSQSQAYRGAIPLLGQIVRAFHDLPEYQLVIASGPHCTSSNFGYVPTNIILCSTVPQLEIMSQASVVITHGGLGTIKEAIMTGVPMVVIPFANDQPVNARRVAHHGIGRIVRPAPLPPVETIKEAVTHLTLNALVKSRVRRLKSVFSNLEMLCPTVSYIETMTASRPMANRSSYGVTA
jgi:UDP:flavonoid glycosyltransferase YjiC (YdhE family)